ncbi:MAG: hypothetical protein CM1200mP30_29080 [Pseudomonadota bacterium]|nr:MAG: hypothetical protein CM1200mP30_29080 [Pseudomonadota bacterium]
MKKRLSIESSVNRELCCSEIKERMANRNPGAPFTTSTFSRRLRLSLVFLLSAPWWWPSSFMREILIFLITVGALYHLHANGLVALAEQALQQAQEVINSV